MRCCAPLIAATSNSTPLGKVSVNVGLEIMLNFGCEVKEKQRRTN
jgi:hypothetical protein